MEDGRCYFCGSSETFVDLGISLGMSGQDYWFCLECAGEKAVIELIRSIFEDHGYEFTPTEVSRG